MGTVDAVTLKLTTRPSRVTQRVTQRNTARDTNGAAAADRIGGRERVDDAVR
jgi:hypothetical protein